MAALEPEAEEDRESFPGEVGPPHNRKGAASSTPSSVEVESRQQLWSAAVAQLPDTQEASPIEANGKERGVDESAEADGAALLTAEETARRQQRVRVSFDDSVGPNPFAAGTEEAAGWQVDPSAHEGKQTSGNPEAVSLGSLARPQLPPDPPDEHLRLETIKSLGLDRSQFERDPMLVSMCEMISQLMKVPIVGISILQEKKLYMCASIGLPDGASTERHKAACSWTLLPKSPEVMAVEDMLQDSRFRSLEHCQGPSGLRFYAGAPLLASNGSRVGAVCVLDIKPRKMSAEDYNMLSNFAEIAMRRLEERGGHKILKSEKPLTRSSVDLLEPIVLCDVSGKRWWSLLYCNAPFSEMTGIAMGGSLSGEYNLWKYFQPRDKTKSKAQESVEEDIQLDRDFKLVVQSQDPLRDDIYELHFRPATKSNLTSYASLISVPNIIPAVEGDTGNGYYFATAKKLEALHEELASAGSSASDSQAASTKGRGKKAVPQRTYMSAAYLREPATGSKQASDAGMRDVTMGVLCSSTPNGLVYRARWKHSSVSVKVIEHKESTCICEERFGNTWVPLEAALSIDLEHPHILRTVKVVLEDRPITPEEPEKMVLAWMVREWCGRGKLTDALHRGWLRVPSGKPNVAVVLAVAQEVAQAMAHLHAEGIIHGDLCPDSVLLADDGERSYSKVKDYICKLAEFGRSIRSREPVKTTKPGTATHAAPELLNTAEMSPATDVYAFGMLLWEIYCGEAVWPSLNVSQLQRRVVHAKEKPPLPPDIPLSIKDLIHKCLENQPTDRPSFKEVLASLRSIAQEQAAGELITALTQEQPAETKHRARLFWKGGTSSKEKTTIIKKLLNKVK